MKVGGTKVGIRGSWVSNAPTKVLSQKWDWGVGGRGHFGDKSKQSKKLINFDLEGWNLKC